LSGPLLLAVETATATTGVALLRGETLLGERCDASGSATAEVLLPLVDGLLADLALPLDAVDAFAVSIGPGSFTGLRIGLATVKAFALGSERPAIAVPTLAVLAQGAPAGPGPALAMLDARRGEVYAAAYADDPLEPVLPEGVYDPETLAERLSGPVRMVGEGVEICGRRLEAQLGGGLPSAPDAAPRAADLGRLAVGMLARGEGRVAAELVPRYVRRAQAEVLRTGEFYEAETEAGVE
jgi:tRNA threonylcarbamoyladenosine biosynthesis protein TsaB